MSIVLKSYVPALFYKIPMVSAFPNTGPLKLSIYRGSIWEIATNRFVPFEKN